MKETMKETTATETTATETTAKETAALKPIDYHTQLLPKGKKLDAKTACMVETHNVLINHGKATLDLIRVLGIAIKNGYCVTGKPKKGEFSATDFVRRAYALTPERIAKGDTFTDISEVEVLPQWIPKSTMSGYAAAAERFINRDGTFSNEAFLISENPVNDTSKLIEAAGLDKKTIEEHSEALKSATVKGIREIKNSLKQEKPKAETVKEEPKAETVKEEPKAETSVNEILTEVTAHLISAAEILKETRPEFYVEYGSVLEANVKSIEKLITLLK